MTMDITIVVGPLTKDEAAQKLGLAVYDTALPQNWLDDAVDTLSGLPGKFNERSRIYDTILSGVVWCYDQSMFGSPRPLTIAAMSLLTELDRIKGTHYIDELLPVLSIQEDR